jgi:hypothetical protein
MTCVKWARVVLVALVLTGCSSTRPVSSPLELRTIDLGDHPDPNTGTSRIITSGDRPWPLDAIALAEAVRTRWSGAHLFDLRRGPVSVGSIQTLREAEVRVLDLSNGARISLQMFAAPAPLEVVVPLNETVVIGSETPDQRHAFIALTLLDQATTKNVRDVASTLDPQVRPPVPLTRATVRRPSVECAASLRGTIFDVLIDAAGRVESARWIGGRCEFATSDVAAMEDALRSWSFAPATRNGHAVASFMALPVEFSRP